MRRLTAASIVLAGCLVTAGSARTSHAQTVRGRVLDERDQRPVATALIRLVDESGEQLRVVIADSAGAFTVGAPGPGTYRLEAARLGFENFETPLLEVLGEDGVYAVELLMRAAPVELPGFTVGTNRLPSEEVSRSIRLILGVNPAFMRYRPIDFLDLRDHIDQRHTLEDVLRFANFPGLDVRYTTDGPCFSLRGAGCLPVFLNGMILNRDFLPGVPLDMLYSIVVVSPGDGVIQYPIGAVLLYTEAWLR